MTTIFMVQPPDGISGKAPLGINRRWACAIAVGMQTGS
jgi:hypothetical protein